MATYRELYEAEKVAHAATKGKLTRCRRWRRDHLLEVAPAGHPTSDSDPDPEKPQLPLETPLNSQAVHQGYGICQHVNFQTNIHQHQAEIFERYGQMRVHQMRSMYAPALSKFKEAVAASRAAGVKWHVTVATIDTSKAEIEKKINHMADNNPELIGWIEGINEPQIDGNFTEANVKKCADIQRWIYEAVRRRPELNHVVVYSCSMHDVKLENSGGKHWMDFATYRFADGKRGGDFCDGVAIHGYPGGTVPDFKRAERIRWAREAWEAIGRPNIPLKWTEWGYTNATGDARGTVGGHKVASEEAAAVYDVQGILDFASHGYQLLRYEFMDDPDASKTVTESNFGIWEVESISGDPDKTWTPKKSVAPLTEILTRLEDPGPAYSTKPVELTVTSDSDDLRWVAIQNRSGRTDVWLWRYGSVWNPTTRQPIKLASITATVTDQEGERTVTVSPAPSFVTLR